MTYVPNTILAHPTIAKELRRRNITHDADIRDCPDVAENHAIVVKEGRVIDEFRWIDGSGWHSVSPNPLTME